MKRNIIKKFGSVILTSMAILSTGSSLEIFATRGFPPASGQMVGSKGKAKGARKSNTSQRKIDNFIKQSKEKLPKILNEVSSDVEKIYNSILQNVRIEELDIKDIKLRISSKRYDSVNRIVSYINVDRTSELDRKISTFETSYNHVLRNGYEQYKYDLYVPLIQRIVNSANYGEMLEKNRQIDEINKKIKYINSKLTGFWVMMEEDDSDDVVDLRSDSDSE